MSNPIENLVAKLISEGKISEEEISRQVSSGRKELPSTMGEVVEENRRLQVQVEAASSYTDFLEEVIVEIALMVYS